MVDKEIRPYLRRVIQERYGKNDCALIIEELGIRHGLARIDIAVLSEHFIGYEIKSDSDSLRRLPLQIDIYNSVFKEMNLIVGYKLAAAAIGIVPEWWGIKLVHKDSDGKIIFQTARTSKKNPFVDKNSLLKLLWKAEAAELLRRFDINIRHKKRNDIYNAISNILSEENIYSYIIDTFKGRPNWRAVELQM